MAASCVCADDLDNDANQNIISAFYDNKPIFWHKNSGSENPTFTNQIITIDNPDPYNLFIEDKDNNLFQ